ncbi:MAG: hypothetical protein ACRDL5_12455, partial [Solirubrobacteraceae bacterium]
MLTRPRPLVLNLAAIALAAPLALSAAPAQARAAAVRLHAHGSVEQAYATGLQPHVHAELLNSHERVVTSRRVDAQGGVLFAHVKPGAGYRVRLGSSGDESAALTVHTVAAKPWDPSVYDQRIRDNGYQY